jgi:hypothetical protein
VIAAGGLLGGYGGNLQLKRELLRREGLEVSMSRIRGFATVRWPGIPAIRSMSPRRKRAARTS